MASNTEGQLSAAALEWLELQQTYYNEDTGMNLFHMIKEEYLPRIKGFNFADDDILISTYPRSGTTWTQEMTWLICNNADTEGAKAAELEDRAPCIEFLNPFKLENKSNVEILEGTPAPRVIKTHFVPQYFSKFGKGKFKVIMMMRNPKDVAVSVFHFYRNLNGFKGTWEEFFEMFKQGKLHYSDWLTHVLKSGEVKDYPNVLLLNYEDAKKNHAGTIKKIADFIGKSLTEEQIKTIADYTTVGNMKKVLESSKMVEKENSMKEFIRKGVVGDWSTLFNKEQLGFMEGVLKEIEANLGLRFVDNIN